MCWIVQERQAIEAHPSSGANLDEVKTWVQRTRNPSVAAVQRHFRLGFQRAEGLMARLEGELVTPRDSRGWRRMLVGETVVPDAGVEVQSLKDWRARG